MKSKRQKARIKKNHTTSSPDDWLLPFLGSDLRLDCKKKKKQKQKTLISSKRMITTNCNIKERIRKEALPFSLSLSLYRVSKPLLLTTSTPRGSRRTMDRRTHRNLGKRRLYLSLHPGPFPQKAPTVSGIFQSSSFLFQGQYPLHSLQLRPLSTFST